MKVLVLLSFVALSYSAHIKVGANIAVGQNGTVTISDAEGNELYISQSSVNPNGLDMVVNSALGVNSRLAVGAPTVDINSAQQDTNTQKIQMTQANILAQVFRRYQGNVNEQTYQVILEDIQNLVNAGYINETVMKVLSNIKQMTESGNVVNDGRVMVKNTVVPKENGITVVHVVKGLVSSEELPEIMNKLQSFKNLTPFQQIQMVIQQIRDQQTKVQQRIMDQVYQQSIQTSPMARFMNVLQGQQGNSQWAKQWNQGNSQWGQQWNQRNQLGSQQWNQQGPQQWNQQGPQQWNLGWNQQVSQLGSQQWKQGSIEIPQQWNQQGPQQWNQQVSQLGSQQWKQGILEIPQQWNQQGPQQWNQQVSQLGSQQWKQGILEIPQQWNQQGLQQWNQQENQGWNQQQGLQQWGQQENQQGPTQWGQQWNQQGPTQWNQQGSQQWKQGSQQWNQGPQQWNQQGIQGWNGEDNQEWNQQLAQWWNQQGAQQLKNLQRQQLVNQEW